MLTRTMSRVRRRVAASVLIALCTAVGAGMNQHGEAGRPSRERSESQSPDSSPLRKAARDRVRDELRTRIQRGQEALAMLDNGATYEEVRRKFPEMARMRADASEQDSGGDPMWGEFGGRRDGYGGPPPREMTDSDKEDMRALLAVASPRLGSMLADLESRDPKEAEKRYRKAFERMHALVDLRRSDPRGAELRLGDITAMRDVGQAAKQLGEAKRSGASSAALTEKRRLLRQAVSKRFDAQVAMQQHEVERRLRERDRVIDEEVDRVIARESGSRPSGKP